MSRPASGTPPADSDACYGFAVRALRRHIVVRQRPPACAQIPQAQVNQDVARAIRTVIGSHPKAVARRLAVAESRYLAPLVRPVPAPRAASFGAAAPASSSDLTLRFSALATWLAAAAVGAYLISGLLNPVARRPRRRKAPALPVAHASLAIAGLVIWIAFTVTTVAALAWADVGLTWVIAGLGMATLLAGPEPQASTQSAAPGEQAATTAAPFPSRAPVVTIALHGALATLTILLVLLAAVGIG